MVPLKAPGERAMTLFRASLMAPRWAAGPSIILGVPGKKGSGPGAVRHIRFHQSFWVDGGSAGEGALPGSVLNKAALPLLTSDTIRARGGVLKHDPHRCSSSPQRTGD